MKFTYDEYIGDRWSTYGSGLKEHKKTIRLRLFKRTFSLSWIWAIDQYGRRSFTPFSGRMNFTAISWQIGYVRLHISKKS